MWLSTSLFDVPSGEIIFVVSVSLLLSQTSANNMPHISVHVKLLQFGLQLSHFKHLPPCWVLDFRKLLQSKQIVPFSPSDRLSLITSWRSRCRLTHRLQGDFMLTYFWMTHDSRGPEARRGGVESAHWPSGSLTMYLLTRKTTWTMLVYDKTFPGRQDGKIKH